MVIIDEIKNLVDQKIIELAKSETKRDYLGASIIGESCERKIQYQYTNLDPDEPISAMTRRIFERGHEHEGIMFAHLFDAGFRFRKRNQDKGHGFQNGKFQGNIDGIIEDGPVALDYPLLWENKAVGAKAFKEISIKGIKTRPVYAAQVAVYQAYMNLLNPALFTVINCDTMEIYYELVPFDQELAQGMSDKAARIIDSTENNIEMPRVSNHPDYFECNWCKFKKRCWQ